MKELIINEPIFKKEHLPFVVLDKNTGIFKIFGYLIEEKDEIDNHFVAIYEWINNYLNDPNICSDFYFGFYYINDYGVKCITNIMTKIKKLPNLKIFWVLNPDAEDMEELVIDISNKIGLKILLIKTTDERYLYNFK